MVADPHKRPDGLLAELTERQLLGAALAFVLPVYLATAWLLVLWLGKTPLLAESRQFISFALCSAAGLGLIVFSFWLRQKVAHRGAHRPGARDVRPLFFGLMLSEAPAFLGLVYFILFRDWLGFVLLLAATSLAFIAHAFVPYRGE